ncbi:glycosyltransferase family 4 protein [bacterium]|jgi:glycosyltransferase involved in cell wall biosynthesis|nr:glycosyltransferase family 4 protein [bacterium]
MKILIVTGIYPPDIGGPAMYCYMLREKLGKLGCDVKIITFSDTVNRADKNVITISRNGNWLLRQILCIIKIISHGIRSDVIYANGLELPVFIASFFLFRKRRIAKITKDFAWEYAQRHAIIQANFDDFQYLKTSGLLSFLKKIQLLSAKKMDSVVVPSDYLKNIVEEWGISRNRIVHIRNAYSPPEFKVDSDKNPSVAGSIQLLTAGRFVPWKNIDKIINCFSSLPEEYRLAIVGEGPLKEYLQNVISSLNLWDRINHFGYLQNDDLFKLMLKSDCFLLYSSYEGLSHVLIESQFAGLPSVVTDVGGNREIISDGKNGFLIKNMDSSDFAEKITQICKMPTLKHEMKMNCIKKSREYSWESHVAELIRLFKNED